VTKYTIAKGLEEVLHIGFDDTDHRLGKCTTHLAFKITEFLLKKTDTKFIDYPLLIRLNPNIPWKTRGNGAVCLRIKTYDKDKIIEFIKYYIEKHSAIGSGANPGVAFFQGEQIPQIVKEFSRSAMFDILSRQRAEKIAKQCNIQYFLFGNGQGLVGSIAAIGCLLHGDYTFEAIAYRRPENYGTTRKVDVNKVIEYNKNTFPYTFNNYDQIHKRILIAPHGPDPVFCGIRGESPEVVVSSLGTLEIIEKLDGYMVFRSNQGTNMHLQKELKLSELKSFISGYIRCNVSAKPHVIQGGHTLFAVQDSAGINILAAVYEPTGLTNIASQLEVGDVIEIGCGVRKASSKHSKILNIEYLSIIELVGIYEFHNPKCQHCGKRMKSEGRDKGFQCSKCKYRKDNTIDKVCLPIRRRIKAGLYIPTPKAHRHLTKPLHRYGIEKKLTDANWNLQLLNGWFFFYGYNNTNNSTAYS
jgi:tRNA(Ile2)-agmatinylcytidine synthase